MTTFIHTATGRTLDVAEVAAAGFRKSEHWSEQVDTPSTAAPKAEWEAWADANGHDPSGMTKQQLVELSRPEAEE